MSDLRIDVEAKKEFIGLLERSETLVWADKPQRLAFTLIERFHLGFGALFAIIGFVILFVTTYSDTGGPYIITINGEPTDVGRVKFYLFLSVFPAAGLFFVALALISAKLRTGSYYAMSDTRVLVRYPSIFGRRDKSVFIQNLSGVERLGGDKIGTLLLLTERKHHLLFNLFRHFFPSSVPLAGISKPAAVERFIVSRIGQGATP